MKQVIRFGLFIIDSIPPRTHARHPPPTIVSCIYEIVHAAFFNQNSAEREREREKKGQALYQ